MLMWEFQHAQEAEMSGEYVTWRSDSATEDCFRVGSNSKCFCGHMYTAHQNKNHSCEKCPCKKF